MKTQTVSDVLKNKTTDLSLKKRNIKPVPVKPPVKRKTDSKSDVVTESSTFGFNNFMNTFYVEKGRIYTHVRLNPGGKYYINDPYLSQEIESVNSSTEIDLFWTKYCDMVQSYPAKGNIPTFAEKPTQYTPLRVDLDLKLNIDAGCKFYISDNHIDQIVERYQKEIKKIVPAEVYEDKLVWCIRLDKKPYIKDEKGGKCVKNGYHLHFPYFICDSRIFEYLRGKINYWIMTEKLFDDIPTKYIKENANLDKDIGTKTWYMYGSACKATLEPYMWGRAYDNDLADMDIDEIFESEIENIKKLKCYNKDNNIEYYLPRLMSVRKNPDTRTPIDSSIELKLLAYKSHTSRKTITIKRKRSDEDVLEDYKKIKEYGLIDMLSKERADNYDTWIDVGWTLFNITEGSDEGLELWREFSTKSDKYYDGVCEKHWYQMCLRNKTLASLMYMAKVDSPDKYAELQKNTISSVLYDSLRGSITEYKIFKVIEGMYGNTFVCSNSKQNIWYKFDGHRYKLLDNAHSLKKLISTEVVRKYIDLRHEINRQKFNIQMAVNNRNMNNFESKQEGPTEDEKTRMEECDQRIDKIGKIIDNLQTIMFIEKIVRMASIHMLDEKFEIKRDENKLLIGCENGVLDLEMGIFREGRPDDYITYSTGINYNLDYTESHEDIMEIKNILFKTFPNEARRKYFIDFLTISMRGGNINKKFLAQTGIGNNGKSVCMKLLSYTFGDYCGSFPREIIIKGKGVQNAEAPRPSLARVRGKRYMIVSEVAEDEEINIGALKELSGNDGIFVRSLHEKGSDITPMFTMLMQCNKLPKVPSNDIATWNRLRVLLYESLFDNEAPSDIDEQFARNHFEADLELMGRLPDLASAFLWLLFNKYKETKDNKTIEEPKEVKVSTDQYKNENDIYRQFIDDKIEKIQDVNEARETKFITGMEMYTEFNSWFVQNYPSYRTKLGRNEVKAELTKKLGALKNGLPDPKTNKVYGVGRNGRVYGYRIVYEDDDEAQSDTNRLLTGTHNNSH